MYLQTTEEQSTTPSDISEDRNFKSLHQKIALSIPKSNTRRPVPPIPVKPSRSNQATAVERDPT